MIKNFKILAAASIVSFILLSSCTTTSPTSSSVSVPTARTFTVLKDNESLNLLDPDGETMRFTNFEMSIETNMYLNVITRKTYTLSRSLNQFGLINASFYNGYWYALTTTVDTDEELLGIRTDTLSYEVSYLIQETNEAIAIKQTSSLVSTFDYAGGWTTRSFTRRLLLNNWFTETTLQAFLPDLYAEIDAGNTETYYIDVTVPGTFVTDIDFFEGFYYFSSVE